MNRALDTIRIEPIGPSKIPRAIVYDLCSYKDDTRYATYICYYYDRTSRCRGGVSVWRDNHGDWGYISLAHNPGKPPTGANWINGRLFETGYDMQYLISMLETRWLNEDCQQLKDDKLAIIDLIYDKIANIC